MSRPRRSAATRRVTTAALVVKVVPYGEGDAIVTLFTEQLGKIAALARRARSGAKKLAGVLDSLHTLSAALDERAHAELFVLAEASIIRPRLGLLADLSRIEAAGTALRWVRAAAPARTPEPEVWAEVIGLLDRLDDPADRTLPEAQWVATGLRLLRAFGYGLELGSCVRCGRPCDPGRSAHVDATAGGLVCRDCGGSGPLLTGATRARLAAAADGQEVALLAEDIGIGRDLVERALASHTGTG